MGHKRDVLSEIMSKRARLTRKRARFLHFSARFKPITSVLEVIEDVSVDKVARAELRRYVPLALVAALEGYYRFVIRDLIDYGDPFRGRAQKLDEPKIGLSTLLGMQQSKVSVGEFISHTLALSSVTDISRHLSILIGENYIARLKRTAVAPGSAVLSVGYPRFWEDFDRLFAERHIFAHELATRARVRNEDARRHWTVTIAAVLTDDTLMEELMPPKRARR